MANPAFAKLAGRFFLAFTEESVIFGEGCRGCPNEMLCRVTNNSKREKAVGKLVNGINFCNITQR